jgi:hypothetical protein
MLIKPENIDQTVWDSVNDEQKEWIMVHESLHENARRILDKRAAAFRIASEEVINKQLQ